MSEDERLERLDHLRYLIIDVLDSRRGCWVAALVFGTAWGSPAAWLLPWGAALPQVVRVQPKAENTSCVFLGGVFMGRAADPLLCSRLIARSEQQSC